MQTPGDQPQPYRAYLLRCWRESETANGQFPLWRFSLEQIGKEPRRRGFRDLASLLAFLRDEFMEAVGERRDA